MCNIQILVDLFSVCDMNLYHTCNVNVVDVMLGKPQTVEILLNIF